MKVINNAGSESMMWSRPVFVDASPAVNGHVKDGWNWKTSTLYQPHTDKVGTNQNLKIVIMCMQLNNLRGNVE